MAERIQLKDPGSELVMHVGAVKPEVVERNDYYQFSDGVTGNTLLVPQSSVKAQMERLDITDVQQMIGKRMRFGRSQKMSRAGKPYWDIDWSSGAENGSTPAASAPVGGPSSSVGAPTGAESPEALRAAKALHAEAMKHAVQYTLDRIVPLYKAAEIGLTGEECYKHAFSIFASWRDAGLIR